MFMGVLTVYVFTRRNYENRWKEKRKREYIYVYIYYIYRERQKSINKQTKGNRDRYMNIERETAKVRM